MGAESTAGVVRTLLDAQFRSPDLAADLSNLIVMTAQTGDEWSTTLQLVDQHVLPLLREHRVRTVEVARRGPRQADGVMVLQDTRTPQRMHGDPERDGFYPLSAEHRANGVLPQLGGSRKCSAKAKGWPLDAWRERAIGARPYLHAIGYSADEANRIATDVAITMGGQRQPIYPIHECGWTRQDCLDYLHDLFGIWWPKSCCRQCPFAGGKNGWIEQLARFQTLPGEAAPHVVDEDVAVALNPRSALFGPGRTLRQRLDADGATEVVRRADAIGHRSPWALYRVRRLFHAPATAWRSVQCLHTGTRAATRHLLDDYAHQLNRPLRDDDNHPRLWITHRDTPEATADATPREFPQLEEYLVAAPAQAQPKARPGFDRKWVGSAPAELLNLEAAIGLRPGALTA